MVTTFDRLTSTLSPAERTDLLKRVQGLGGLVEESLAAAQSEEAPGTSELEHLRLGFFGRLLVVLTSLFSGKTRGEVLREMAARRLADQILVWSPGLLDRRRGVFLRPARDEIEALGQAAGYFRECLRRALGEDQDEFIAFLTGHLLPHVQERMAALVNLGSRGAELETLDTSEIRRRIHEDLETAFSSVAEPERRIVYTEIRALHGLRGLAAQPFPEILECFNTETVPGECAYAKVRKYLPPLDAQMQAVRRPPTPAALEGLFLFSHAEEIGGDFPLEERLTQDLQGATEVLAAIRTVARHVPFTKVVRLATGILDYLPRPVGGGEDWYQIFKRYWTARVEQGLRQFGREREKQHLREEIRVHLGVHRLPSIGVTGMTGISLEVALENELALILLVGFSQEVFYKVSRPLALLLDKARFVREENRRELAQVHGYFDALEERIDVLLGELRADPELGKTAAGEARRGPEQRATRAMSGFLDECTHSVKLLVSLLDGILRGSPGNRFDTVFNLNTLGDWQDRLMSEILEEAYERVSESLGLLAKVRAV
jgi:hypothetical protein